MTIDEAIKHGKDQLEIFGGEHKEFIETSIDTMRKYQMIELDYKARLRADMVAMLSDIQLEIEEYKSDRLVDMERNEMAEIFSEIIQEKIKSLQETKEET